MKKIMLLVSLALVLGLVMGCPQPNDSGNGSGNGTPQHVPVTNINGISENAMLGRVVTLTGTVEPSNATNKDIVWSLTQLGAGVNELTGGNTFTATSKGQFSVLATIKDGIAVGTDYTQSFIINVTAFVPVTSVSGAIGIAEVGEQVILTAEVGPWNATNRGITWSIKDAGTTGVLELTDGNTFIASQEGTLVVTATITNGTAPGTDFTQDFSISILDALPPLSIQDVLDLINTEYADVSSEALYILERELNKGDAAEAFRIGMGYNLAYLDIVQALLRIPGVDVNSSLNDDGVTPLMLQSRYVGEGVVLLLLGVDGIDVNSYGKATAHERYVNKTALDLVREQSATDPAGAEIIEEALLAKGAKTYQELVDEGVITP